MDDYLIVMRLKNMHRRHPDQDNSKVCSICEHKVGIYPSGQEVLKEHPGYKIVCHVCEIKLPVPHVQLLAPGALQDTKESYDVRKRN